MRIGVLGRLLLVILRWLVSIVFELLRLSVVMSISCGILFGICLGFMFLYKS